MDRQQLAADRLVRRELTLLRSLGRDRRTASARLTPLIASAPAAQGSVRDPIALPIDDVRPLHEPELARQDAPPRGSARQRNAAPRHMLGVANALGRQDLELATDDEWRR